MTYQKEADKHNSLNGILEGRCGAAVITCAVQYNFYTKMLPLEVRESCFSKMHDFISSYFGWKVGKV